jgi:hypothetical protein
MNTLIIVSLVGGTIIIAVGLVIVMAAGGGFNKETNDKIGVVFDAIFDR